MSISRNKLLKKINSVIKKINKVYGGEYEFELIDVIVQDRVNISIGYVRKFLEISELVGSIVMESGCNANTDECEKLFEKLYNEEIDRINEEYAINIDAKLKFNDIVIEFYKLQCNSDYCDVGLVVDISIPLCDTDSIVQIVRQVLAIVLQIILLYDATLSSIL